LDNDVTVFHLSELMPTTEYTIFVVPFNAHQFGPSGQLSFFTPAPLPLSSLSELI